MQAATKDSVAAVGQISATIGRISEISSAIAVAIAEQDVAAREISHNAQRAADGATSVSSNIADVNRRANETGSASEQVLASAHSLSSESVRLSQAVERFLHNVRAA